MTKVHIVLVMKVCFFFSYSDEADSWDFFLGQPGREVATTLAHLLRNRPRLFAGAISTDTILVGSYIADFRQTKSTLCAVGAMRESDIATGLGHGERAQPLDLRRGSYGLVRGNCAELEGSEGEKSERLDRKERIVD